ncbi:MAG: biotin transporter BioY [Gemmatimonadetes bacterium]|nr:biotin transporter BioY [Gemmatimonadota bacterium]
MNSPVRTLLVLLAAALAVAIGAQVSLPVPGSPVPQTLQTLAVVLAGAWLGSIRGPMALILYVIIGAAGAPVFADGGFGMEHLTGPTAGYLAGFVLGAAVMGAWVRGAWGKTFVGAFVGAVVAHIVILGLGWLPLAASMGEGQAFNAGVQPFLVGGLAKSLVAAALWVAVPRPAPAPEDDEQS